MPKLWPSRRKFDRVTYVISDCHLSAGRVFNGQLNTHEDFHFDDDLCDLFEYFSSGDYGKGAKVELFINGDFFDFLNVSYQGEFDDAVDEKIALSKLDAILAGHPDVMEAIRRFVSQPGKKVTYLIGNHDIELLFESVRRQVIQTWDPEGRYPSDKVEIIADRDRVIYEKEGVELRHGNQFEPSNEIDFNAPFSKTIRGKEILNLPWGSVYILKVINRLRYEREHIDKIRPVKVFMILGMIFDTIFTLRFMFLSFIYFLKTRVLSAIKGKIGIQKVFQIIREEFIVFQDLEGEARELLDYNKNIKTVIFGHTHRPMDKVYPDGKQYINTGSWTKMVDLYWKSIGARSQRTFALIHFKNGQADCELREWVGEHSPHKSLSGT